MATTRVRGITIELGADTSGVAKALKTVNSNITGTQKQLKDVERLLKLDPTNTELLAQKQKLLGDKVADVTSKLKALKSAEEQMNGDGAEHSAEEYAALERAIISCEKDLEQANDSVKAFNKSLGASPAKVQEIAGALDNVSAKAAIVAEKTRGLAIASTAALGGAVALGKKIVDAYSDYEQLTGGVETLFGKSSDTVMKYASEAYKTAGLSANQYMETVTSFSAALISSLGGNTEKAAELADVAITDMADNANKMGTDMTSIQNAYQGFAKQNYTMLDNLKLGYGGTKTEMERLLATAEELSGVHYDISSYADVVQAIHTVQSQMGITGTTAKEASETVQGSISAFKAAWENLLTGLGSDNADIDKLTQDVVDTFGTMAGNVIEVVKNIWNNLPTSAQMILLAAGAVVAINLVATTMSQMGEVFKTVTTIINTLGARNTILLAGLALMALLVSKVVDAWGDMNSLEKVAAVLGLIATAAFTAALAMGAFESASTAGIAAAGIALGIATVLAAVKSAQSASTSSSSNLPMMANGGTINSGSAIVGEAGAELLTVSNGAATVTPLTNNTTTVNNYGSQTSQPIELTLNIDGKAFARATYSNYQSEGARRGASMVTI